MPTMAPAVDEESSGGTENEQEETVGATNGYNYGAFPDNERSGEVLKPTLEKPSSTRALAPDLLRGLLSLFMALDHTVVGLNPWEHGTGLTGENDSVIVEKWNFRLAYILRTLSHLCAPGFTFALGMGVVYFGRSRARLGWSGAEIARHFAVRGFVLVLVTALMGFVLTFGQIFFLNMVLAELGINYFLVGILWLGMLSTEPALTRLLSRWLPDEEPEDIAQPLLRSQTGEPAPVKQQPSGRAEALSWHFHNVLLLVLAIVTVWWNIWFSPTHGHCEIKGQEITRLETQANGFWRWWIYPVMTGRIMSAFPPFAWISFAIVGVLYARISLHRPWSVREMFTGNMLAGVAFSILFIMTRVLRIGNLSEGCLQTPEHIAHPNTNPYLLDVPSFFYIVKYPPDVAFFAFTLAGTFFLLAGFGALPPRFATRWLKVLLAFGTSALFFYIAHFVMLLLVDTAIVAKFGHLTSRKDPITGGPSKGVDNLWVYWGSWLLIMAIMYPLCKWYSSFKKTRTADSVWRLF